jgi:AraC-like DNA-binding protein
MRASGYALDTTWRTLLKDLGVAPADVLRRAGLPDDLLQRPTVRLAPEDYYRLWRSIETEVDGTVLAVELCRRVRSESFSPLLFAALCSPDLVVAARRVATYKALVAPIRFDVTERGDRVTVEMTWLDPPLGPPTSLVMMELLFCVTLARIGTREPVRPVLFTTRALPDSLAPYEDFLGTPVGRGARNQVTFTGDDARLPFLTSNDSLWTAFEPDLRARLADLATPASTSQRARAAVLEGLPSGLVTVEAIARKLALSPRTLQRQIKAEGTSYQQILRQTRESLAQHYLERTALPASEISFLLGFDEPNSFYRAFKTWTGTTPDRARTQPRGARTAQQ